MKPFTKHQLTESIFDKVGYVSIPATKEMEARPKLDDELYLLREMTKEEMDEIAEHYTDMDRCNSFLKHIKTFMEQYQEGDRICAASSVFVPLCGWAGFVIKRRGKILKQKCMVIIS